jgi:Intracellular septation protein A
MKGLLHAGRALLLDMAATLFFLLLYGLTGNITLSVILGLVLALGQIGWQIAWQRPVDTLQWVSLFLVAASGAAMLVTHDPVFVMLKPSVIYGVVGAAMLKRGWMNRYLPPIALETGVRHGDCLRLCLGGADVFLRRAEYFRRPQLQHDRPGRFHVGLRHCQQTWPVCDSIYSDAHRGRAALSRAARANRRLTLL